ncbi:hypothetical protein ON010_g16649 [Phytophthora cinnamomi]|nr:hypothetical protein ON010_g16649 [Phytophthora cinnamomi]
MAGVDKQPDIDYSAAIRSLMWLPGPTWSFRGLGRPRGFFKKPKADSTSKVNAIKIEGFCDSDWGNCPETRKSVTGYAMLVAGGSVAWAARRQTVVSRSTAGAEYVASFLPKTRVNFTLGVDNQAASTLQSNPTNSRKTRHIELRLQYVREQVARKPVTIWKVGGDVNPADLLTKPPGYLRPIKVKQLIGMHSETEPAPREKQRKHYHDEQHL